MRMKQKKNQNQNGRLKKTEFFKITNSQKIFEKISQIVPWVSRINHRGLKLDGAIGDLAEPL
jgi:hypothetical protein